MEAIEGGIFQSPPEGKSKRLRRHPHLQNQAHFQKTLHLREGLLSDDNLTDAVDNLTHEVQDSGALLRDKMRWPDSNFGADYELFKRMALYRMKILDYYFDGNLEAYMGLGFEQDKT